MNRHRFWQFPLHRRIIITLIALAWSKPALCDEIHAAARDGDVAKAQTLLNANPELVFSKDIDGMTPLHYAVYNSHKEIAELLIANKAEVNARDNDGYTPLHYTALKGYKDVAELLIANKAEVDARSKGGYTPLHNAASGGHEDMVQLLLANKADVNAMTKDGLTPLQLAMKYHHENVVGLFRQKFTAIEEILILSVIDSRADKKAKADLEYIRTSTQKILERKHYRVVKAASPPSGARWVMVIGLNALGGRVPGASVSGALCDKESQAPSVACVGYGGAVWSGSGAGQYTSSAVAPPAGLKAGDQMIYAASGQLADLTTLFLMPGSAKKVAVYNAVASLLGGIPELPKKKKR